MDEAWHSDDILRRPPCRLPRSFASASRMPRRETDLRYLGHRSIQRRLRPHIKGYRTERPGSAPKRKRLQAGTVLFRRRARTRLRNPMFGSDSTRVFATSVLEVGEGALFSQLFELAPRDGVALVALTADGCGWGAFSSTHETGRAGNLVRTSLRPLTSSRKSGTTGAQPTGLGAHLVDASSNYGL
jgi:hypothetical protein